MKHQANMIRIKNNNFIILINFLFLLFFSCNKNVSEEKKTSGLNNDVKKTVEKIIEKELDAKSPDSCIAVYKDLIKKHQNDSTSVAFLTIQIANCNLIKYDYDAAIINSKNALEYFKKNAKNDSLLVLAYQFAGHSYFESGKSQYLGNIYMSRAASLVLLPKNNDIFTPKKKFFILMNATSFNTNCQQYEKALHYAKKSLDFSSKIKNDSDLNYIRSLLEIGLIYSYSKKFDSANYYLKKVEKIADDKKLHQRLDRDIYLSKANIFYNKKEWDSAIFYSKKVTEIDELHKDSPQFNAYNYSNNFGLYTRLHKQKEASEELQKLNNLKDVFDDSDVSFLENKVAYEILYGNKEEAEKMYWDFVDKKEEEYSKERLKQYASIEAEYDLVEKERKIAALNIKNEKAEKQKNSLIWIAALALLLTLFISIFTYLVIRQRKLQAIQKSITEENSRMYLEQRLLRTQMEPHFIFNTLSSLQSFIRFDEKEKSLKYLNQFSKLLRSSLELSRQDLVPLDEELETLQNYLSLQQMRNNNIFEYQINTFEIQDISSIMIPPMLIQPFVENAIIHGLDPKDKNGLIEINIQQKENLLLVNIKDNGNGFSVKEISARKQYQSLSGTIAKERLELLSKKYNTSFNLFTTSEKNVGTRVELSLPLL